MKLYHTSPRPLTHIDTNGYYGDVLFFSSKPWWRSELTRRWVYVLELEDHDVIPVGDFNGDDMNAIELLTSSLECSHQQAVGLLSGKLEPADESEARLVVRAQARAAKDAGYTAALLPDGNYIVGMRGLFGKLSTVSN